MAKKKNKVTYRDIFKMLKTVATATHIGRKKIKGNKKLELQRAELLKDMEDNLANAVREFNFTYIRSYKHLYPKTKPKKK